MEEVCQGKDEVMAVKEQEIVVKDQIITEKDRQLSAQQSASRDMLAVKDGHIAALCTELRGKDRILQAKTRVCTPSYYSHHNASGIVYYMSTHTHSLVSGSELT